MKVRHVRTIPRQTPLLRNRHQKWTAHPRTTNPRDRVIHLRVGSVGLSNSTSGAHHEERGDAVDVGVAEGVPQIGPIEASICRHVVGSSKPFVVDDARARLAVASAQSAADEQRLAAEAELKSATARPASDASQSERCSRAASLRSAPRPTSIPNAASRCWERTRSSTAPS